MAVEEEIQMKENIIHWARKNLKNITTEKRDNILLAGYEPFSTFNEYAVSPLTKKQLKKYNNKNYKIKIVSLPKPARFGGGSDWIYGSYKEIRVFKKRR